MTPTLTAEAPAAALFRGTYISTADGKGRLVLPVTFRRLMAPEFVICHAPENGLLAFHSDTWARISEGPYFARWRDFYLSGSVVVTLDRTTGRFLIPLAMRDHADLFPGCDVAFAGLGDTIAICRRGLWEEAWERMQEVMLDQLAASKETARVVGSRW